MKRLLVRRFESCVYSFMETLDNIISSNVKIKDWYDTKGKIPIYKKGSMPEVFEFEENIQSNKNFDDLKSVGFQS